MNVLFLAVGGSRRVGVATEATTVLDGGGQVAVLVADPKPWKRDKIDRRVKLIEVGALETAHAPLRIERKLLFGAPRKLLGKRLGDAFTGKVANRVHARLVIPTYRRVWGDKSLDLVADRALRGAHYDYVIVADPTSIPYAERIAARAGGPPVRYSLDFAS